MRRRSAATHASAAQARHGQRLRQPAAAQPELLQLGVQAKCARAATSCNALLEGKALFKALASKCREGVVEKSQGLACGGGGGAGSW
eukprot:6807382-Alexandrium_andersonii.AAC.1